MNDVNKTINEFPKMSFSYHKSNCSNTYEKHYRDNDTVIVVYDSGGRMSEVRSVYGIRKCMAEYGGIISGKD